MADIPEYYWDACMWIALINQEAGRDDACRYVLQRAQRNEVQIWTSSFTLAEVFKKRCIPGTQETGISASNDANFEDFIEQPFVTQVQVDRDVGVAARRLLRRYPVLKKPQDAVHLATALIYSLDELHTFDGSDLIRLDGQIEKPDGELLKICEPPSPPDPNAGTLFEGSHDGKNVTKKTG
ncbi:type II toxin-antitoxin system VapC family toxin [Parvularcula sp. LCG005]|uniref:type II toxin-antitoxin system VapC family toxin n=1 Tax=Parvularcula sp. LCG005 TaxID=3078805 RepID=UPI002942D2FA|nr:PIN domain-containing protein [Parvularcula sp. LCG005]WOI53708.1 PIN domain-containing protein [Parvularcula sp. LCG005]